MQQAIKNNLLLITLFFCFSGIKVVQAQSYEDGTYQDNPFENSMDSIEQPISQPNTLIEDVPYPRSSNSELLRKKQRYIEEMTSRRIMDKMVLESLKTQQERSNKLLNKANNLFGNSSAKANTNANAHANTNTNHQQQPQQQQQPVFNTPEQNNEDLKSSIKDGIKEAFSEREKNQVQPAPVIEENSYAIEETPENTQSLYVHDDEEKSNDDNMYLLKNLSYSYFFATAGSSIHGAANVSSKGSFGLGIGAHYSNQLQLEAGFMFSRFILESWDYYNNRVVVRSSSASERQVDVLQYSGILNVKYSLLKNMMISPFLGGSAAYTYRTYEPVVAFENGKNHSHAMDAGALAGLQLNVERNFLIAAEWRYMFNVTYSADEDYRYAENDNNVFSIRDRGSISRLKGATFEEAPYSTVSLVMIFKF